MASFREMSLPVQLGVGIAVAALVVGLGYYGALKPMMEANAEAQQKLDAQKTQNDSLRHYKADLPRLEAQIASLKQQLEIQKKIVPDEKEADQFLHMMQETAAGAGVEVRRYTSKPTVTHDFYSEMPFDIDIDGPYYSVLDFFARTAKLERIIDISGLKMATPKRQGDAGVKKKYDFAANESVVANITATTYFSHEPAPPSATPAKGAPGAKGATPAPAAKK
jgi:type IV pilus assembly protein PilO